MDGQIDRQVEVNRTDRQVDDPSGWLSHWLAA